MSNITPLQPLRRRASALLPAVLFAATLAAAPAQASNEVLRWNEVATGAAAATTPETDPLTESRVFAILHLAIRDAADAAAAAGDSPGQRDAAIAAAAHEVLVELLPIARPSFAAALDESLARVPDGPEEASATALGRQTARRVLDQRRSDGADRSVVYAVDNRPGRYRPTPPDFTPAFMVQWGQITPFALRSADQFRPAPPPAPGSAAALAELAVVREIGAQASPARSAEQSEIARFWFEGSTQGWNRIARNVARARGLDTAECARLLALLNVAMADGFIAGFEAKFHYAYWRPATAIRAAGETDWLSELWTPPVPDHPSTHTVLGAAAATVLERFFGTDFVSFEMTSGIPYPGITRRFWSFSQAARENGASRVLAGIHFPSAVRTGYLQGEQVGAWVFEHLGGSVPAPESLPTKVATH